MRSTTTPTSSLPPSPEENDWNTYTNSKINFSFQYENVQEIKTLFTQEMLKKGFLAATTVYVSYSHTKKHVQDYLIAVDEVFSIIKRALAQDKNEIELYV